MTLTGRTLMTRDDGRSSHRGRGVSYFRAIAAVIDVAWDIAAGADLAFPQVPGKRSVTRCDWSTPTCRGCTRLPPTTRR